MPKIKRIIEGLQILAKYKPDDYCAAEHDVLYGPDAEVTEEERKKLDELEWFYDDEVGCWCCFT